MVLPIEITEQIGKIIGIITLEVEKGAIGRFADAVGDHNPLYNDEAFACNTSFGCIIAPPGFFGWPRGSTRGAALVGEPAERLINELALAGFSRILDGGMDYEFYLPVKAGDILTAETVIENIRQRKGTEGNMAFVWTLTTYRNQDDEIVAKARRLVIHR